MSMKDGFNFKTLFPNYSEKYLSQYSFVGDRIILYIFTIIICIVGLVGNGNIVWLLGFRMKRKPFAIYFLNLAVADFGFLVFLLPSDLHFNPPYFYSSFELPVVLVILIFSPLLSIFSCRQLLLTAISIDRWVSVLFPRWYQCHRSPVLSTTVCAFIWAFSFALVGVPSGLLLLGLISFDYGLVLFLGQTLTTLICLSLVIISTLTLFIKVCLKSQQSGNLLKVILLMLLSFLLFTILTFVSFIMFEFPIALGYISLWTSLKSSINPLIYFLAGRENSGEFQERMKVVLQRVFKEARDTRMGLQPCTETRL